ncbi:MAG: hypothetical protein FWD06_09125 [Oscillospiraceae bacterium]|nr:hypothetical protein [Oscillospiraceae bacterium]
MALYTERHGMRKPIERTSTITIEMYSMLLDCCEKYYYYLSWKFPENCFDGRGCCGVDENKLNQHLLFDIPSLFRNSDGVIAKPQKNYYGEADKYDQYALLDLIEYIAQNCKDVKELDWHAFFKHYHLRTLTTNEIAGTFRDEINEVFYKTGLLFTLTSDLVVERIIEDGTLTTAVEKIISAVKEKGLKDLLNEAVSLFKQPNPALRNDAVEKLWDAFERLKTYYTTLDKKDSAEKIIKEMSNNQIEFEELFRTEFFALTKIGNDYRIRHHETNKIDIVDIHHYDYFFNRCLALIAMALRNLQ